MIYMIMIMSSSPSPDFHDLLSQIVKYCTNTFKKVIGKQVSIYECRDDVKHDLLAQSWTDLT